MSGHTPGYVKILGLSHPTTVQCFRHMSSMRQGTMSTAVEAKAGPTSNTSDAAQELSDPVDSRSNEIQDGIADQQRRQKWWRKLGSKIGKKSFDLLLATVQ